MFERYNWMQFDPLHFHERPDDRLATAKEHGNAWSVWTGTARKYQTSFDAGDRGAIMAFARSSKSFLLAPWVITALRRWQSEGTAAARKRVRDVITAWLDSRGKDQPYTLLKRIRRDKAVVCEILRRRLKGETVEEAVGIAAERHGWKENTAHEIHKKYSSAWRNLKFRDPKMKDSKMTKSQIGEFLSYLQQADPDKIWETASKRIDDEQTGLFLYLEVLSLIRSGDAHFEDLYPGWPPPGEFLESWARGEARDRTAALVVYHRIVPKGSPANAGDYLRVDVYRDLEPPRQEPDNTFLFEKSGNDFHSIQPTMPRYEDWKNAIR